MDSILGQTAASAVILVLSAALQTSTRFRVRAPERTGVVRGVESAAGGRHYRGDRDRRGRAGAHRRRKPPTIFCARRPLPCGLVTSRPRVGGGTAANPARRVSATPGGCGGPARGLAPHPSGVTARAGACRVGGALAGCQRRSCCSSPAPGLLLPHCRSSGGRRLGVPDRTPALRSYEHGPLRARSPRRPRRRRLAAIISAALSLFAFAFLVVGL